MKYPGMKIPTLREGEKGRAGGESRSPQMCSLDGNGRGTGAARKRDRMQARRSWNQFKWYRSAPPFSASPPTPPPFLIFHSFSLAAFLFLPFPLSLAHSAVL